MFGAGVYHTASSDVAVEYAMKSVNGVKEHFIFVNEIINSSEINVFLFDSYEQREPEFDFEHHKLRNSPTLRRTDFKIDSLGRRYRNIFVEQSSLEDEYIASSKVVEPSYLIYFEQ